MVSPEVTWGLAGGFSGARRVRCSLVGYRCSRLPNGFSSYFVSLFHALEEQSNLEAS